MIVAPLINVVLINKFMEDLIMSYLLGEKFLCDSCGAEIIFTQPCTCERKNTNLHSNFCCNKEMRSLRVHEEELAYLQSRKVMPLTSE